MTPRHDEDPTAEVVPPPSGLVSQSAVCGTDRTVLEIQ
jgi:hypothetical protein